MRRFAAILPLAAAVALSAAVLACDDGDERGAATPAVSVTAGTETDAQRQATAQAVAALTGIAEANLRATRSPFDSAAATARSVALTAIPTQTAAALAALDLQPRWVRVLSPDNTLTNPLLQSPFLMNPHSGEVWELDVPVRSDETPNLYPSRPLAWNPQNELLLVVSIGSRHELYLSAPPDEPRLVAKRAETAYRASWSPDGELVALGGPDGIAIVRADDWSVEFSRGDLSTTHGGWSADGAYLALQDGPLIRVYDRAERTTTHAFFARDIAWESSGTRLAYFPGTGVAADGREIAVRLLDARSGADEVLTYFQASFARVRSWSPGDRFIAVDLHGPDGRRVELVDLEHPGRRVRITLASSHGWIDSSTALVVGDYCDTWTPMAVSAIDGNTVRYTPSDDPAFEWDPYLSPDRRFAILTSSAGPALMDVKGGTLRALTGAPRYVMFDLFAPEVWSPDGRFVIGRVPGGRDGPCLQEPAGRSAVQALIQ